MSWNCLSRVVLEIFALSIGAWAQGTRPEAGPFDAAHIEIQPPPAPGVAVRAGRLFDPKSETNLVNQVILIRGDRIADTGPASRVSIPPGVRVIDLSQATVLPGLIDRHVHLIQDQQVNDGRATLAGLNYALKDLNAGFTTLQDMGSGFSYATVELRDAINKGLVPGPRLQVSGPQLNPRGATYYPAPSVVIPFGLGPGSNNFQNTGNINSPWLARAAVRERSHYGVDWIKVYETEDYEGGGYPVPAGSGAFTPDGKMINVPSLTLEENQAIVDEAHRRGLKVACHAYGGEGLRNCLAAGVDLPMHVIVGVTGAISAVRRELFRPIPSGTLLDDVYWPLLVAMQGYRVIHEPRARAYDRLPERPLDEFQRKLRTLTGNFQLVARLPQALLPWRNPIWFQFLSHKLLRLLMPWAHAGHG